MPTVETGPLNVNPNENAPLDQKQCASRSSRLYQRQRPAPQQDGGLSTPETPKTSVHRTPTLQKASNPEIELSYFNADHRKIRRRLSSPSDSGTEADDEKGAVLLGLPAPPTPTRLRKGLKGAYESGTASPLLTPSYLDEEPSKAWLKTNSKRRSSLQSQSCTEEEKAKLREKFTRRRRAELVRRITETLLLGVVGFIACRSLMGWLVGVYAERTIHPVNVGTELRLGHVPAGLLSHAAVVLGLYALYPVRIIYTNSARNSSRNRSRFYIHIPAAFEPAPLLYPILVPVFIAQSLMQSEWTVLIPNLVLSISSIPSKIIPFNTDTPWYSSIQWLLSAVPISSFSKSQNIEPQSHPKEGAGPLSNPDVETMLLLYPLHQVLLPTLGYLTTTSLLPAELQLLSMAMINLLLLSESPQMVILQSILWIGGLSVFLLCGKVLIWGVALARIPSWRFQKPLTQARQGNVLLSAIDDCVHGRLSDWGLISTHTSDSDSSDTEGPSGRPKNAAHKRCRQMLSVDNRCNGAPLNGTLAQLPNFRQVPAFKDVNQTRMHGSISAITNSPINQDSRRQRSNTLPSNIGSLPATPMKNTLKRSLTTQFHAPKAWSLRSFTRAQAITIKWIFALYTYAVVIATIVFAIRVYVGHNALYSQEPIGWALGYLLADIPIIKELTIEWNLDSWIRFPSDVPSFSLPKAYSWVQLQTSLGAANIRLLICVYCLAIIIVGLAVVFRLSSIAEVDTRRKVFHGMMVAMFLPTIFIDPAFISLAFILILAIFLLLDLFRASQLPPLSKPLTYFLAPYVDGRDHRGPVIVSHIFLLIGCAIPLWLSLAAIERTGEGPWRGWDVQRREVSLISGVVCVGMGDAAASLIGRRYGHRRWCWSGGKSLEGSFAFAIAVVLGLSLARLWLLSGGWEGDSGDSWPVTIGKATIAAICASLTEAVLTGGNDNVVVPVILWLLVRGLRI